MAHFLKRLEINGFKSFAARTVLEFPSGITAIVGPNGSGKSNIIDAIRWLLGERDAKNLRGGKAEDLIFGGTPTKARLGQAQAALYFENANRFFPTDFAEVSIMRQVNRDGTSQYFLNKAEIRLRDLVDFFAQARLGSRGLTVIGQGDSDIFIKATPSVRRGMIEEMLGLREYQIKKTDAERRLKNAQINLDKARALMEEILPHLRSLKRQAHRWEKRSELESELATLEQEYFGSQLHALEQERTAAERVIALHAHEHAKLDATRIAAEKHLKEIEDAQPKEREALTVIKTNIRALMDRRGSLQKDIGRLEAQLEHVKQVQPVSLPSAERLFDFVKKIRNTLHAKLDGSIEDIRASVKSVLHEIEKVLTELPDHRSTNQAIPNVQPQLVKINADLEALEKELGALKEQEKTYEQGQESFYASFKKAVGQVESAKDALERWATVQREKEFERERITLRREEIIRQITQTNRSVDEFARYEGRTVSADELAQMERRMFRLRGDLASIGEIDEALVQEAQSTETRYTFLEKECQDLEAAKKNLKDLIVELQSKMEHDFTNALVKINQEFTKFFDLMFNGGHAKLKLTKREPRVQVQSEQEEGVPAEPAAVSEEQPEEPEQGIEIEVSLPRKKIHSLEMLSGGERSLTAIAALFAMISVSPPPFLVLDEVDAALDERNARRFSNMLQEFAHHTQFVVVTHNRATMEAANHLYGVTMQEDGTSKVLSLRLEETPVAA